jgi:hypothetical protein
MGKGRSGMYASVVAIAVALGGAASAQAANKDIYARDAGGPCFSSAPGPATCVAGEEGDVSINTGDTVTWDFGESTQDHNAASSNAVPEDAAWEGFTTPFVQVGRYPRTFNQPGTYEYLCQAHPVMRGTITVTGEPVEPPDDPPPPPPPPPPPSSPPTSDPGTTTPNPTGGTDSVKPRVRSVRPTALRRGVRVRFTLSEPATVTIRVERGRKLVKSARVQARAGTRSVTLRSKKLKKGRYRVEVQARDAHGNRSTLATKRLILRR